LGNAEAVVYVVAGVVAERLSDVAATRCRTDWL
jgi:hypothetical protein